MEEPSWLFQEEYALYIPIYLETGVKKPTLVNKMHDQIKEVLKLLASNTD